jgi:BMFP domain-containing protein YqiC
MSQSSLLDWIMALAGNWDAILQPILEQFALINDKLDLLIQQGAKEMAELDDLKMQVSTMLATAQQGLTDIDAAIQKLVANVQAGVDPAEVEAQAQVIAQANDSMKAELAKLEAALNPPAPPPQP